MRRLGRLFFDSVTGAALVLGSTLLLAACAAPLADEAPLAATRVGDGVYAFIGSSGEADRENRGEVGNGGFIVGERGTLVINTGASYRHGQRIIAAAERIGGKPVELVVITQPLQEFVMGSAAFEERGIPIAAQAQSARLIGQRCERCLRALVRLLGDDAMRGTTVVVPGRTFSGSQTLVVGGRTLRLLDFGWAQTPGDLAILDERTRVLFAGGLVSIGRVPDLRDADEAGWRRALAGLQALRFERLVPGYGPVGGKRDAEAVAGYLSALEHTVERLQRDGAGLLDAVPAAGLADYEGWRLYSKIHSRNVQRIYLQLEGRNFGR